MAQVRYISFKHRLQDNQLENFLQVFVLVVESIGIKMEGAMSYIYFYVKRLRLYSHYTG